jgi:hypothetical protein
LDCNSGGRLKTVLTLNEIVLTAIVFAANGIHVITGFAGTLLAMPAVYASAYFKQKAEFRATLTPIGIIL